MRRSRDNHRADLRFGWEDSGEAADEWDSLARKLGAAPFMRPGWHLAWQESFAREPIRIWTVRQGEKLLGALPLLRSRGALVSPTNWHTPIFEPLAERGDLVSALASELLRSENRRLDLSFLPAAIAAAESPLDLAGAYRRRLLVSPYIELDGDWQRFEKSLSKNLRGTIRRCRNRLADLGEVALEVVSGSEGLGATLERCFELEQSGWKGERGSAILSSEESHRFYRRVSEWAAESGILCLALLTVGGEPIAFNLSLESGGRHYLVKLGHDARHHRAGPGTVLTAMMVERSFERGLSSYEFLGAEDSYKMRWASGRRERFQLQIFPRGMRGSLGRVVQTRAKPLARSLRHRLGR